MYNIFELNTTRRPNHNQQALNLKVVKQSPVKFGSRNLRVLVPKIWNSLPPHVKNAENLFAFKRKME